MYNIELIMIAGIKSIVASSAETFCVLFFRVFWIIAVADFNILNVQVNSKTFHSWHG
jgi:hypothetical protein